MSLGTTSTKSGDTLFHIGSKACSYCQGSGRRWPKVPLDTPAGKYAAVAPFDDGSVAVLTGVGLQWQAIKGRAGTPVFRPGHECEAIRFAIMKNAEVRPANAVRQIT